MNTKVIKLEINKCFYEMIIAKQGDTKSRFLLFQLFDNSISFDLSNKTVRVFAEKPDGKEVYNDLVINDAKKGVCTLELTNQMLAVPGFVKMELVISTSSAKLSSIPFVVNVVPSINSEDAIVSTNEFTALSKALSSLSEYDSYKKEIEIARGGEVNLSAKIQKLDSDLESIVNEVVETKINKNEANSISMEMLTTQVKTNMTGGKIAVVGGNSVSMAQLSSNIQEDIGNYISKTFIKNDGFYVPNTGETKLTYVDNINFQNVIYNVSEGEKFKITVGVSLDNFILISFLDNATDLNIIDITLRTTSSNIARHDDYEVIVPHGAGVLLVQGQNPIKQMFIKRLDYIPIATKNEINTVNNNVNSCLQKLDNKAHIEKSWNLYDIYDENATNYSKRIVTNASADTATIFENDTAFWSQMCLIKVALLPNTTYTRNNAYISDSNLVSAMPTVCYDIDGKILKCFDSDRTNVNNGTITFKTPESTSYCLMGTYKNFINSFMIVEGTVIPNEYNNFYKKITVSNKIEKIQPYWEKLINKKAVELLKNNGNEINICFFSDNHIEYNVLKYGVGDIIEYLDIKLGLDNVLFGGDLLVEDNDSFEAVAGNIASYKETIYPVREKVLACQGNHETYYNVNGTNYDISENKAYSILRSNSQKGCITSSYSKLSYYYDDIEKKIRYIVLDWRECNEDVCSFVFKTLKNIDEKEDTNEWCVLFMMHSPFISYDYLYLYKGLNAIKNKIEYTHNYISINDQSDENSFIFNNKISIVGILGGHHHFDWCGTKFDFDGEEIGINIFLTSADALLDREDDLKMKMARNSIYNHVLNIVTIDNEQKKVTINRLGGYKCGKDFEWNGTDEIIWEY